MVISFQNSINLLQLMKYSGTSYLQLRLALEPERRVKFQLHPFLRNPNIINCLSISITYVINKEWLQEDNNPCRTGSLDCKFWILSLGLKSSKLSRWFISSEYLKLRHYTHSRNNFKNLIFSVFIHLKLFKKLLLILLYSKFRLA